MRTIPPNMSAFSKCMKVCYILCEKLHSFTSPPEVLFYICADKVSIC